MKALEPKDYLRQFEPELAYKLAGERLRGEVERVMKEYLIITLKVNEITRTPSKN